MVRVARAASAAALGACALFGLACGGILDQPEVLDAFETAKAQAMAEPATAKAGWTADAAVVVSHELVGELVAAGLDGLRPKPWTTSTALGNLTVTPSLDVDSVTSRPGSCPGCLDLVFDARGEAAWELAGIRGSTPYTASATARVQLSTDADGSVRRLLAEVTRLTDVHFTADRAKGLDLGPTLQDWLERAVDDALDVTPLAEVDTADLPVREVRPEVDRDGVRLAVLSKAPNGGKLTSSPVPEAGGWAAAVSTDTLVSLAAAEGFARTEDDLTVEVTGLAVRDSRFDLDLRIWSTGFPAWWHDYKVTGDVDIAGGQLRLKPEEATPGDASAGAGVIDALSTLAGTPVVDMITDALRTTVPVPSADAGGVTLALTRVEGTSGSVVMHGGPAEDTRARPGRGSKAREGARPERPERPGGRAGGRGKADSTRRPR